MKSFATLFFILFFSLTVTAQDTHYWTHQFGTRSALMGGAVVGGMRDNSMVFYNPAAVAFIDSAAFSINANIYQVENTKIKNILTEEKDFSTLQLASVPLLTSGQFKVKKEKLRLSYGIFAPVVFQFRGQARLEGPFDVVEGTESAGNETFVGDQQLFSRLRELDIALGASYQLGERWAIGLTNQFDVRSHNYNRSVFMHYFLNNADATRVNSAITQTFNYWHVRYMPKLGLVYKGNGWSWGVTFTSPGIQMKGSGAVGVDIMADNVLTDGAARSNVVANGREEALKVKYRSPFSVATGVQIEGGKNHIGLTAQYFGRQKIYNILSATKLAFVRPATVFDDLQSAALMQVKGAAKPVLNIALGWEHQVNEKFSILGSIRNNQSYYDAELLNINGIKPDITTWDTYHLVGGITRTRERSSMSLGLALGYGKDKKRSDQLLPLPNETRFYKSPITQTTGTYTSAGILVGYNYFFKKG